MVRNRPAVDVICLVRNRAEITVQFLTNFANNTTHVPYRLTIIDNDSTDNTKRLLRWFWANTRWWVPWARFKHVRFRYLRNKENKGFSEANNQGAKIATAPWLLFINNDVFPKAKMWLYWLLHTARSQPYAAVGPITNSVVGIQNERCNADGWPPRHKAKFLSAFCVLIRKNAFDEVGGFDEDFFYGDEDLDLSLRLRRAGYDIGVNRAVNVFHVGSASMVDLVGSFDVRDTEEWFKRTRNQLLAKHGPHIEHDLGLWENLRHPEKDWRKLGVLANGFYHGRPGKTADIAEAMGKLRPQSSPGGITEGMESGAPLGELHTGGYRASSPTDDTLTYRFAHCEG
jgi:GT2 family glycosyltransferase